MNNPKIPSLAALLMALLMALLCLPGLAYALGVVGDKPGKAGSVTAATAEPATVLIEAVLGATSKTEAELNGIKLPFATDPPAIHGPQGRLSLSALRPGMAVRAVVSRDPRQRKVFEIRVLR